MTPDDLVMLRREFEGEGGSFLSKLRPEFIWDKVAFSRLIMLMEQYCKANSDNDLFERWLAQGFWYIPQFVRDWTTHSGFPRQHAPNYYEQAYRRLDDLAYWFFIGDSPYVEGAGFEPL